MRLPLFIVKPSYPPRLQALPVLAGRLAEVLRAVAAEIAQGGEIHQLRYLGERQAFVIQIFLYDGYGGAVDVTADTVTRHALDGGGEILRRDVQPVGIIANLALGAADARGEQVHQVLDDNGRTVAVHVGSIALGMRLEDVVHHCEAEAPHQLAVEHQVAVVHAVAQTAEVGQDDGGLLVGEMDDGVVVE